MQEDYRKKLLLELYNQLWNSINIRMTVIWQSISILVGAFAVFALVEKKIINIDIATSLIVLICGWFIAHVIDASFWFNRNLVILGNIDREFLVSEDMRNIYFYFQSHKPQNTMVGYLRIQFALGVGILLITLTLQFTQSIYPLISSNVCDFNFEKAVPYFVLIFVCIFLFVHWRQRNKEYKDFIEKSPGK